MNVIIPGPFHFEFQTKTAKWWGQEDGPAS
jgi:hypothetical protein